MIANKKEFMIGFSLMAGFLVVLAIFFMPVFYGHNGLNYLDSLYNSISKGSAYYIPKMQKESQAFEGQSVNVTLDFTSEAVARQTALLFNESGAMVNVSGSQLKISGDLGVMLKKCLEDADHMYINDGEFVKTRYGYDERQALFNWWTAFKAMNKNLQKQEMFKEAKIVNAVQTKAIETAYNYYGIKAEKISDKLGIVVFSLVFYVIYTMWYGYGILFMMEGLGLQLEH
jgi:hypothetical protein